MISSPAILVDTTRCTGCEECVLACKQENHLGADRMRPGQETVDGLSSTRFSTILRRSDDHFVKQQCRHCLDPACVSACLVGAMQKTPEGPVIYDSELCMGCRYCLVACPYGIPRYQWDASVPYVRKCDLCYARLQQDKEPACVEACPNEALDFGSRDDLLAEAHRRIRADRERYVPHVYGEREVGGTSVLYLADISLGFLGWGGHVGDEPLPMLSWASLKKVPPVIVGMGTLMGGIHWVIRRRMQLAARAAAGEGDTESIDAGVPAGVASTPESKGGDDD
jgi:formate dehydrogenase iron-sulfur subunit